MEAEECILSKHHGRQVDHQKGLCIRLWQLQQTDTFCDIYIEVENKLIPAHLVVLAACSPVLRVRHSESKSYCGTIRTKISTDGIDYDNCLQVLKFMYTGELHLSWENVFPIHEICRLWGIKSGQKRCVDFEDSEKPSPDLHSSEMKGNNSGIQDKTSVNNDTDGCVALSDDDKSVKGGKVTSKSTETPTGDRAAHRTKSVDCHRHATSKENTNERCDSPTHGDSCVQTIEKIGGPTPNEEKIFSCKRCQMTFKDKNTLKKHSLSHKHNTCHRCHATFDTSDDLIEHRKIHMKEKRVRKRYTCEECQRDFATLEFLKSHQFRNHWNEDMENPVFYYCKEDGCEFRTLRRCELSQHGNQHRGDRPFTCDICSSTYKTQRYLRQHKQHCHSGTEPQFTCEKCSQRFKRERDLRNHIKRRHDEVRPYMCNKCPQKTASKGELNMHRFRKHAVPLPKAEISQCPFCDYSTPVHSLMKTHIQRHSDERPFQCVFCEKSYHTEKDLKSHTKSHKSDRERFKCDYCEFSTVYGLSRLRKHVQRIHMAKDIKPWQCSLCDFKSNLKGNLHQHLRKVHQVAVRANQHLVKKITKTERQNNKPCSDSLSDAGLNACSASECPTVTMNQLPLPKRKTSAYPKSVIRNQERQQPKQNDQNEGCTEVHATPQQPEVKSQSEVQPKGKVQSQDNMQSQHEMGSQCKEKSQSEVQSQYEVQLQCKVRSQFEMQVQHELPSHSQAQSQEMQCEVQSQQVHDEKQWCELLPVPYMPSPLSSTTLSVADIQTDSSLFGQVYRQPLDVSMDCFRDFDFLKTTVEFPEQFMAPHP